MTAQANVQVRRDERGRALELPPAMAARMWQKGQAPNPTGKSGLYQEVRSMCRKASPDAAAEIIRLGLHSEDERVRFMCNQWVHEQAWGKPPPYDPSKEAQAVPVLDPSQLSPKQLDLVKRAMTALLGAMTVSEVIEPDAK